MPKGPQGQKRPADVIGNAVRVMQIATGGRSSMRSNNRTLTGLLCVSLMLASPAICSAATFTVNTTSDTNVVSGDGSLRGEILAANATTGPNTINFNIAGTGPFTIALNSTNGPLTITGNIEIDGPTTPSSAVTIDGGGNTRLFNVNSGATLNLQYLTLQNGNDSLRFPFNVEGGAIDNEGTLSIANCTLSNNQALGGSSINNVGFVCGGAIVSGGTSTNPATLTIADSTLASNRATGGGSLLGPGGDGVGGAICFRAGTLTVTNTTFSGNQAIGGASNTPGNGAGGAIALGSNSTAIITNATFSGNQAINGTALGGAINNSGTLDLKGTILAASVPGNCFGSPATDDGYNLADDGTCNFTPTGTSIVVMPGATGLDPNGLAANGGPTKTIALQSGSGIDAIPLASCTDQAATPNQLKTDQRGFGRPDDGETACDIGAYESGAVVPPPPFAGQPGAANCLGMTDSALSTEFGTLDAAAAALGFPSVKAMKTAIRQFCGG